MLTQKGGFALNNFIDIPSSISSLSIPIGIHHVPSKQKKKGNYNISINDKPLSNIMYNNIISTMKSSASFNITRKNKIKLNKKTRKYKK